MAYYSKVFDFLYATFAPQRVFHMETGSHPHSVNTTGRVMKQIYFNK